MKILEKLLEALGADELFQEERVPEINRTKYLEPTNRTYEISKKLAESDDEFSVDAMLDYAKKVFLEIHKAVYFKNAEPIRKLVSPVLFRIIEDIIVTEEIEALEEYEFDSVIEKIYITSYRVDTNYKNEFLTVCIIMTIPGQQPSYVNKLCFKRECVENLRVGIPVTKAVVCPNCGASLDSILATRCDFCNAVINVAKNEWELSSFEIVKHLF